MWAARSKEIGASLAARNERSSSRVRARERFGPSPVTPSRRGGSGGGVRVEVRPTSTASGEKTSAGHSRGRPVVALRGLCDRTKSTASDEKDRSHGRFNGHPRTPPHRQRRQAMQGHQTAQVQGTRSPHRWRQSVPRVQGMLREDLRTQVIGRYGHQSRDLHNASDHETRVHETRDHETRDQL